MPPSRTNGAPTSRDGPTAPSGAISTNHTCNDFAARMRTFGRGLNVAIAPDLRRPERCRSRRLERVRARCCGTLPAPRTVLTGPTLLSMKFAKTARFKEHVVKALEGSLALSEVERHVACCRSLCPGSHDPLPRRFNLQSIKELQSDVFVRRWTATAESLPS